MKKPNFFSNKLYFWWKICIFLLPILVNAKEVTYLNRSPKALLMGDAYTSIADDEYTLFYNPAALGRHSGLSLSFINPDVSVTNVLGDLDRFKNFPKNDASAITERIMGIPLHLRLGGAPGLKMGTFGLSLMAHSTTNVILRNAVHPSLDIDYRLDRGFIMGYAFTIGNAGRKSSAQRRKNSSRQGGNAGRQTSFGLAVKNVNRQGVFQNFDLFGLELLNKVADSASSMEAIRKSLGYSYGKGWGTDFGVEHTYKSSHSQLNVALSVLDIGDTCYTRAEGEKEIPKQKMSVNLGTSWTQNFLLFDYTFSLDFAPLNQGLPLGRTVHFGMEAGFPIVSALFGWNGGHISYGVGVNIWLIKMYAGFYGVELGNKFKHEAGKRGLIYLSILDFSFDT